MIATFDNEQLEEHIGCHDHDAVSALFGASSITKIFKLPESERGI
jgi:hypothetical protein